MLVYLVRHAEAVEGGVDFERKLTNKGRSRSLKVAKALVGLKCRPEVIISSPLIRAEQTAKSLADILEPVNGLKQSELLAGGADTEKTARWICSRKERELMCVGHVPDMPRLASMLLVGNDELSFEFKKLGVCCISFTGQAEPGHGSLMWFMKPYQLELISD